MSKETNTPTPLSVMLGDGGLFMVKEKSYTVKPIELKDIESFMNDNLSVEGQIFNISDEKARVKVDKWLKGYCFDEEGKATSLETVMNDRWDVVDLKKFFKKLCDFSG